MQQHLIDIVARDQNDLFQQIDSRTIKRFDGKTVKLHLAGDSVVELPMTVRQRILDFLLDPNIAFLVLAVGALALYAEFNHPGAVVPGVVGVIFILLALFALNLLPTRFASLTLIIAAFVMFALEAKFGTHGILALGGIVLLTLGGLLLVDGPIPQMRVQLWTALGVSVPLGLITVFLMSIAIRARRSKVVTGLQGMIGAVGEARRHRSGREGLRPGRTVERTCPVASRHWRAGRGAQSRGARTGSGENKIAVSSQHSAKRTPPCTVQAVAE